VGADLRRFWAWLDGMPRPLAVGEPAAWMEIGAGVALVAAVAIKASSAVLSRSSWPAPRDASASPRES
jgi:uncharacterized membrane protein YphA (DoxX/SURF4 family)